jgi:hypothetical protein
MFTSGSGLWLNLSHKDKGAIFSGEKRIENYTWEGAKKYSTLTTAQSNNIPNNTKII